MLSNTNTSNTSNNDKLADKQINDILLPEAVNDFFEDFSSGYYIGMMSGTSLDGMDVVVAQFNDIRPSVEQLKTDTHGQPTPIQLIATHSKEFNPVLKTVLLALCQPNGTANLAKILLDHELSIDGMSTDEIQQMSELDWFGWASRMYAEFASEVIFEVLEQSKINTDDVLAIGCHGQTVRHRPQHGFTLQLVDANIIAERTGISVVSDFRRRDMAVGGQGAPLVPAFHQAMFANDEETRVLLNLGGIANITVLPRLRDPMTALNDSNKAHSNGVTGYDTGPANLLIDAWAKKHILKSYDADGQFARSGRIIDALLTQLLTHPFFALPAPKSTGREDFHLAWLQDELTKFRHHHPTMRFSPADVQATLTELTAITASEQIDAYQNSDSGHGRLFVCGGGAFNGYLLERLRHHLPNWQVSTTADIGLAPTWVEAVAFAWLARQSLMSETANLPEVTGAQKKVVLGQVCFG